MFIILFSYHITIDEHEDVGLVVEIRQLTFKKAAIMEESIDNGFCSTISGAYGSEIPTYGSKVNKFSYS